MNFALLFAYKPIDAAWDLRLSGEAQCIDRYPFHILQAGSGAVADVIVMAVMLYHCLSPRHSWKDKAVLLTHFSSGLLLPIPAVARLAILATAREDPDTTFVLAPAILCFIIEANLVIMYNLIPDFKRFVRVSGNPSSPVNGTMDGRQGGMLQGSNSILGGNEQMDSEDSGINAEHNADNNIASRVPCPGEKQCHVASSLGSPGGPMEVD
ncbi:integral membrane protein [Fusarium langsethiae]|uniref:Integral membrane protein n=1 Tax=Fusarium langsethiae TaxID=179993 RepID=A0A0N0DC20_FUSLA|nr:integral membrane protein [Fusarium langsethiae]